MLAAPHSSARALSQSFHLAVGADATLVSRPSIGKIKCAFLEMYQEVVYADAQKFLASVVEAATASSVELVPAVVMHVQDGADFRMLSADPHDGITLPKRRRTSKVQVPVVELRAKGQR